MIKIERSIKISAPVEKVFSYISDPMNSLESHPGMTDIRNVTGKGELQHWEWSYKMLGMPFHGKAECTRSLLNRERIEKTTGGIRSTFTWKLQPENGGTNLTLEIDYTIPVPVLGKAGEMLTRHQNEREADLGMSNIKARMEG